MLRPLRLVDRFNEIERELPGDWAEATLVLVVPDAGRCERAAALLGPTNPGRLGSRIRFGTARRGAGVGPDGVRRLLRRLDQEGIRGALELVRAREEPRTELRRRESLRDQWKRALDTLPADWSDVLCEVELTSTDHLERAALLLAPLNPLQGSGRPGFRFRCAATLGYGASPGMTRRCLARLDEAGIPGEVRILRSLSDTHPAATQGPVWYVGGKTV